MLPLSQFALLEVGYVHSQGIEIVKFSLTCSYLFFFTVQSSTAVSELESDPHKNGFFPLFLKSLTWTTNLCLATVLH